MNASLADRCECGYENDLAPVDPHRVTVDGDSLTAEYQCPACGRCWFTTWLASALGAA